MRILPKMIQTALEKRAEEYLHENYTHKYTQVSMAVEEGWSTADIAQNFCGSNFFLGIIIILAANEMYNERLKENLRNIIQS